jgi:Pyruvate/2-oxoacid:ferredoxin oxidoreductase gamma subunit
MQEVTIGIAGAAGDGLDKSGDTLAKSGGRLGLHVYAYINQLFVAVTSG